MDGGIHLTPKQVSLLRLQVIQRRARRNREEHRSPMLYLGGPLDGMRATVATWLISKPGSILHLLVGEGAEQLIVVYRHHGGGCFAFDRVEPFHTGGGEAYRGVHEEMRNREPAYGEHR